MKNIVLFIMLCSLVLISCSTVTSKEADVQDSSKAAVTAEEAKPAEAGEVKTEDAKKEEVKPEVKSDEAKQDQDGKKDVKDVPAQEAPKVEDKPAKADEAKAVA